MLTIVHLRNVLMQVWNLAFSFDIQPLSDMKNCFLITFNHERDKRKVIDGVPWSVNDSLMALKPWPPHLKAEELEFLTTPFGIQVHGLLLHRMTKSNAQLIGNLFAGLIEVDFASTPDASVGSCMRLRVEVNINKPLLERFTSKKENGQLERIRFKFERLLEFCYMGGLVGHQINVCPNISQVIGEANRCSKAVVDFKHIRSIVTVHL
ncbi:hypothetical protein GH714_018447 [Hevea brasiliensis]|uniref:DUF4283 domain-containing protein n=1 Tax=Hevea brasiliensis TaxID=3981 RepID=A0A6A6M3E6_HEVBR|nr:hypothetical protein GH714_018278 [Hevea brasiliensis]KAF2306479.1 hypothetical protein GH714_018447 [Hevea brasiliensis]